MKYWQNREQIVWKVLLLFVERVLHHIYGKEHVPAY